MNDLAAAIASDARLYILKELAAQTDGRLNVILLQRLLEQRYGINRARDWIETQMRKLADLGAANLIEAGLLVAEITRDGRDHLASRAVIVGITRPSEVE